MFATHCNQKSYTQKKPERNQSAYNLAMVDCKLTWCKNNSGHSPQNSGSPSHPLFHICRRFYIEGFCDVTSVTVKEDETLRHKASGTQVPSRRRTSLERSIFKNMHFLLPCSFLFITCLLFNLLCGQVLFFLECRVEFVLHSVQRRHKKHTRPWFT